MPPKIHTHTGPLPGATRDFLLHELGGTGFTSPEAVDYVRNQAHTLRVCKDPSRGLVLNWVLGEGSRPQRKILQEIQIQRVCRRAVALVHQLGIQTPLVFWLIPAPGRRSLPRRGEVLKEQHINGGFTYVSRSDVQGPANIFVYRQEEMPKVVLHEILHHSCYHTDPWDPASLAYLYQALRVHPGTRLLPNEAIVELWAEHYHLLFLSQETGIPYPRLWEAEQRHARQQALRLIHHYRGVPGALWQETTNGMSYLLLRAALFPFFHSTLKGMPCPYDPRVLTNLMLHAFAAFLQAHPTRPVRSARSHHSPGQSRGLRMTLTGDF